MNEKDTIKAEEKMRQFEEYELCECGKPAQWFGDTRGLRIYACEECAKAQGAEV